MATSYRRAVEWIALNDNAGEADPQSVLAGMLTVLLVADQFGKQPEIVARDVMLRRWRDKIPVGAFDA